MDIDGQPARYCGDAETCGSVGYTPQVVGFSDFIRHPFRNQHSLDSHMSHHPGDPELSISRKWNYTSGQISSSSSSTSLSLDRDDKWQLKHSEFEKSSDTDTKKMGRGSTWSSLSFHGVQFDKHHDAHHNLSIVPEIPAETVQSVPVIASMPILALTITSLPVLAASKTIHSTPDLSNMSKAPTANDIPRNEENKSRALCHETGEAIMFSARPTKGNCDLTSSVCKETDSHSIFGLPSRINVTKRELNMMTPSSF